MALAGLTLISAVFALAVGALSVIGVFFTAAIWNYYWPTEKERIRRKAADLLEARSDLTDAEKEFLASLRRISPANRFFLAMPKIFGVVFVAVFAACLYLR